MAKYIVVCDGDLDFAGASPTCTGTWMQVDAAAIPGAFDINLLNPTDMVGSFGLGFAILFGPLSVIFGVRAFIYFLKKHM